MVLDGDDIPLGQGLNDPVGLDPRTWGSTKDTLDNAADLLDFGLEILKWVKDNPLEALAYLGATAAGVVWASRGAWQEAGEGADLVIKHKITYEGEDE